MNKFVLSCLTLMLGVGVVSAEDATDELTATFDFTTLETYKEITSRPKDEVTAPNATSPQINIGVTDGANPETFTSTPAFICMTFARNKTPNGAATLPRWAYDNNSKELRCQTNKYNSITITSTDSHCFIKNIEITVPTRTSFGGYDIVSYDQNGAEETISAGTIFTNASDIKWTPSEGKYISKVVLTNMPTRTNYFAKINVKYVIDNDVTGINGIESDDENASVQYYNLQGIRMNGDNLPSGIYIRRQGSKTDKVLIRR